MTSFYTSSLTTYSSPRVNCHLFSIMGLKLLPAEYTDMRELVEVIYTANSDPRDPFVDLCLPGLGAWSKATREEGVEKITKMYLEEWKESTTQTWLKIIDEDSGKVVRYLDSNLSVNDYLYRLANCQIVVHPSGKFLTRILTLKVFRILALNGFQLVQG